MIETLYPLFEAGRVLKKEALSALRDYAHDLAELEYAEYSDGIIKGCAVSEQAGKLEIAPGILKYKEQLYLLPKAQMLSYQSSEQVSVVKFRFLKEVQNSDFKTQRVECFTDESEDCKENEIEICRFQLSAGFHLRNQYINFEDMQTEFDTINYIHAQWSAPHQTSLSPQITNYFAQEALKHPLTNVWDSAFCMRALSQSIALPRLVITTYIEQRLGVSASQDDNAALFEKFAQILMNIEQGKEPDEHRSKGHRRQIIVG